MLYRILILFLVIFGSICTIQAKDILIALSDSDHLNEILANPDFCVEKVSREKIYLQPERVFATQQGLFVEVLPHKYVPIAS